MVMDSSSPPSPQCVGREFVRQYYTLMNEAPGFLHRFYSADSSFVHSGDDLSSQDPEPVYGQKNIHKKIQDLDFRDCHTKIRQVDSQATVGNGVVVQVTGELSNRGASMRRFMQTFVLAHQTPKQYYVHNDIFRYQDEVFRDAYESEEEPEAQPLADEPVMTNGVAPESSPVATEQYVEEENEPEMIAPVSQPDLNVQSVSPITTPSVVAEPNYETPPTAAETPVEHEESKAMPTEPSKTEEVSEPVANVEQVVKQFSWARIAGGGSGATGNAAVAVVSPMNANGAMNKQPVVPLSVITSQQKEESLATALVAPTTHVQEDQGARANRPEPAAPSGRPPTTVDRRANERYPDSQQVFVGNLPQDVAEFQLKNFFKNYGKVVDMRINRGGGGSGKVPFGFVVFDSDHPVQELLKLKRVEMDGHRLNVEEKKARSDRAGSNSRAPRGPRQQQQRAGSRPKDREGSGSRSDNRQSTNQRKPGRP